MKTIRIKKQFVMDNQDIKYLESLPANLPGTSLPKKDREKIGELYYKYIRAIDNSDMSHSLITMEQSEKWPSGPRIKIHEAQRMILGWLIEEQKPMTVNQALKHFFISLDRRPAYTRMLTKIYDL